MLWYKCETMFFINKEKKLIDYLSYYYTTWMNLEQSKKMILKIVSWNTINCKESTLPTSRLFCSGQMRTPLVSWQMTKRLSLKNVCFVLQRRSRNGACSCSPCLRTTTVSTTAPCRSPSSVVCYLSWSWPNWHLTETLSCCWPGIKCKLVAGLT